MVDKVMQLMANRTRIALIFGCLIIPSLAHSEEWIIKPGLDSATLAVAGWELLESNGLSWPDGRQAIVTFWVANSSDHKMMRCISYFDSVMRQTGDACYVAKK